MVGAPGASRVRFRHSGSGVVEFTFVRSAPTSRASVVSVSFRHRRWAAVFLSHVVQLTSEGITVVAPRDITLTDFRRAPRYRVQTPFPVNVRTVDFEGPGNVVDISSYGIGLRLDGPGPPMGASVTVSTDDLELSGVITRIRNNVYGVAFRYGTVTMAELRAWIHRSSSLAL